MSSEIKVSSVKAKDGTAGIEIADSTGRVSFSDNNPTITLGTNAKLPQGAIANVHCSTSDISVYTPASNFTTVAGGSSVSYTPTTGARFVVYQYTTTWDNDDDRSIVSFKLQLDSQYWTSRHVAGWDNGGANMGSAGSNTICMGVTLNLSNITTEFSGHSSGHDWQTNAGGTSAFSAGTLRLLVACHGTSYEATLCRLANGGSGESPCITRPTTLIYSVM